MAGEIRDPKGEATVAILINHQVVKLTSRCLCLYIMDFGLFATLIKEAPLYGGHQSIKKQKAGQRLEKSV